MRLPSTLVLYAVPLLQEIRRSGYGGKVNAEPALVDGEWVLKVTYEGDRPESVPERAQGHRVIVEELEPADG